jgi:hypothetical protein
MDTNAVGTRADALVVRRSMLKMFLAFVWFSALTAIGIAAILYPDMDMPLWAAIALTAVSAALAGLGLLGLVQGRVVILTITPDGILDSRLSPDVIPWRTVEWVDFRQLVKYQKAAALTLREGWTPRLTRLAAWVLGVDNACGLSGLVIGLEGLDQNPDEIFTTIAHYHAQYGGA